MSCINGFLLASLDLKEIQCWITTLVLQTWNCILEKLQHWPGNLCRSETSMQTQRPKLLPQVPVQHLWGPDFPESVPQPGPHKQDFKPLHDKLKAKPKSLADRNWRKCSFKAANNVIYTCWEFDPIHSLHPITQTINHWNCQILYTFNGRSKQSSRL